jgi:threonine/homoserine/homoserine lactone efflux protein
MSTFAAYLPALGSLAALHLVGAMVPGPNTLLVTHLSASRSRAQGLAAVAGVAAATLIWVVLSLAGVGVVLREAGALYHLLRLLGAAYLVWVGAKLLLSAARPRAANTAPPPLTRGSAFRAGLLTTLSNPKSAAFWTSLFVVAVPPHAPLAFHAAIVAVVGLQSAAWYGFVALCFGAAPVRRVYARATRWIDAVAGAAMVALGLRLTLADKSE